jgi:hypothetical protein
MSINHKKLIDSVLHCNSSESNPSLNYDDKIQLFKITDLIDGVHQTNSTIFEMTDKVLSNLRIQFNGFENVRIETNQYELFEFVYKIVETSIDLVLTPKINNVIQLKQLSQETIPLYLPPRSITEEEMEWVNGFIGDSWKSQTIELEIDIKHQIYYLINLKRQLNFNINNPDFNDSILEYLRKD